MQTRPDEPFVAALFRLLAARPGFTAAGLDRRPRLRRIAWPRRPRQLRACGDDPDGRSRWRATGLPPLAAPAASSPTRLGLAAAFAAVAPIARPEGPVLGHLRRRRPPAAAADPDRWRPCSPTPPRWPARCSSRGRRPGAGAGAARCAARDPPALGGRSGMHRCRARRARRGAAVADDARPRPLPRRSTRRSARRRRRAARRHRHPARAALGTGRPAGAPRGRPLRHRRGPEPADSAHPRPRGCCRPSASRWRSTAAPCDPREHRHRRGATADTPTPLLLMQADTALRRAKAEGRNRFVLHEPAAGRRGGWRSAGSSSTSPARSPTARCTSPTSPSSTCATAASAASRRCCAGATRPAARCCPPPSSRWPRRPARSCRSAAGRCAPRSPSGARWPTPARASPSTSRRCSSTSRASSPRSTPRSPRPASRPTGSSSRSPRPC